LVQTNVPEINTLTSRVDGQNLWLAGITKNPTQPWTSKNLVEVGQFTFNSPNNQSLTLDLGSASNILQHITGTNLLDKETAEDLAEEVFLKVYNKISGLNQAGAFEGWLYQIARNEVIDYYRKNYKLNQMKLII
jgi:predicted RNA polymerase sigma factor